MNMQGGIHILPANETRDARKIRAWNAEAVIALRMAGVGAEHSHRLVAIPKTKQ